MALDISSLTQTMMTAGQGLAGNVWERMQTYAVPELKKIATQIVAIAENRADYTEAGARTLLRMQVNATVAVFVAMTTLTMLEVETAINAILSAISEQVNAALGFALLI